MKECWLEDWPWETVITINAGLCKEKGALHKPTSEGYSPAENLWNKSRNKELTLQETLDVCRQCHKLAPFCFYNGNTFAAIGRTMILPFLSKLPPAKAHVFRSTVGHYIAGTAGVDDLVKVLEDIA